MALVNSGNFNKNVFELSKYNWTLLLFNKCNHVQKYGTNCVSYDKTVTISNTQTVGAQYSSNLFVDIIKKQKISTKLKEGLEPEPSTQSFC